MTKKKETELFRKCFICEKNTSLNKMRCHVGKHILLNQIGTDVPCGYCGRSVCNNKLVVSSKTKGKKNYRPESTCPYFVDVFRKPTKSSKTTPCLNFLEKCNVYNEDVWKIQSAKTFWIYARFSWCSNYSWWWKEQRYFIWLICLMFNKEASLYVMFLV